MNKLLSFDTRPSIAALQGVEQQVVALLETAAKTCEELSKDKIDQNTLEKQAKEYLNILRSIKETMETQISRISPEVPFQNSPYGAKKDAEISYMKAQVRPYKGDCRSSLDRAQIVRKELQQIRELLQSAQAKSNQ